MIKILAIIGIVGGLMCAVADLLLDLKGPENKKLGTSGAVDSMWAVMPHGRFVASDIIAMFAVPMYTCGFIALMLKLSETHRSLAIALSITFLCGAMGGFMIHTFLCMMPTVYQKLAKEKQETLAIDIIEGLLKQISVPFFTLYSMLVIVPSIAVILLIITGALQLPIWMIILNPVVIQIIGLGFRATKLKIFIDAPSCCAASIGLAMYGVLALSIL